MENSNRNSGYHNSGNFNSGNHNSGYFNSGNFNSGNRNSGYFNSGNFNSGNRNSGYFNSGNFNSGNHNSGNFNSGNHNSGYFCTGTPKTTFFDAPWDGTWEEANDLIPRIELPVCCEWIPIERMSDDEKRDNPNHGVTGGYLKSSPLPLREAFPIAWEKASEETRQGFLNLPNFDAEKFLAITGVDVREKPAPDALTDEIVLNGKRYRFVSE